MRSVAEWHEFGGVEPWDREPTDSKHSFIEKEEGHRCLDSNGGWVHLQYTNL